MQTINFVVCAILLLGHGTSWGVDVAADDTEPGFGLYVSYQCHQCHGYGGQGGSPGGPRLAGIKYPFSAFAVRVRLTNVMPAYSPSVLSNTDLEAIYAYLTSIPDPGPIDEYPALRRRQDDL